MRSTRKNRKSAGVKANEKSKQRRSKIPVPQEGCSTSLSKPSSTLKNSENLGNKLSGSPSVPQKSVKDYFQTRSIDTSKPSTPSTRNKNTGSKTVDSPVADQACRDSASPVEVEQMCSKMTLDEFQYNTNIVELIKQYFRKQNHPDKLLKKMIRLIDVYVERVYTRYLAKPEYRRDELFTNLKVLSQPIDISDEESVKTNAGGAKNTMKDSVRIERRKPPLKRIRAAVTEETGSDASDKTDSSGIESSDTKCSPVFKKRKCSMLTTSPTRASIRLKNVEDQLKEKRVREQQSILQTKAITVPNTSQSPQEGCSKWFYGSSDENKEKEKRAANSVEEICVKMSLNEFHNNTNIVELIKDYFLKQNHPEKVFKKMMAAIDLYVERVYNQYIQIPSYRRDKLFKNLKVISQKENNLSNAARSTSGSSSWAATPVVSKMSLREFHDNTNIIELIKDYFLKQNYPEMILKQKMTAIDSYVQRIYRQYMRKPEYRYDDLFEHLKVTSRKLNEISDAESATTVSSPSTQSTVICVSNVQSKNVARGKTCPKPSSAVVDRNTKGGLIEQEQSSSRNFADKCPISLEDGNIILTDTSASMPSAVHPRDVGEKPSPMSKTEKPSFDIYDRNSSAPSSVHPKNVVRRKPCPMSKKVKLPFEIVDRNANNGSPEKEQLSTKHFVEESAMNLEDVCASTSPVQPRNIVREKPCPMSKKVKLLSEMHDQNASNISLKEQSSIRNIVDKNTINLEDQHKVLSDVSTSPSPVQPRNVVREKPCPMSRKVKPSSGVVDTNANDESPDEEQSSTRNLVKENTINLKDEHRVISDVCARTSPAQPRNVVGKNSCSMSKKVKPSSEIHDRNANNGLPEKEQLATRNFVEKSTINHKDEQRVLGDVCASTSPVQPRNVVREKPCPMSKKVKPSSDIVDRNTSNRSLEEEQPSTRNSVEKSTINHKDEYRVISDVYAYTSPVKLRNIISEKPCPMSKKVKFSSNIVDRNASNRSLEEEQSSTKNLVDKNTINLEDEQRVVSDVCARTSPAQPINIVEEKPCAALKKVKSFFMIVDRNANNGSPKKEKSSTRNFVEKSAINLEDEHRVISDICTSTSPSKKVKSFFMIVDRNASNESLEAEQSSTRNLIGKSTTNLEDQHRVLNDVCASTSSSVQPRKVAREKPCPMSKKVKPSSEIVSNRLIDKEQSSVISLEDENRVSNYACVNPLPVVQVSDVMKKKPCPLSKTIRPKSEIVDRNKINQSQREGLSTTPKKRKYVAKDCNDAGDFLPTKLLKYVEEGSEKAAENSKENSTGDNQQQEDTIYRKNNDIGQKTEANKEPKEQNLYQNEATNERADQTVKHTSYISVERTKDASRFKSPATYSDQSKFSHHKTATKQANIASKPKIISCQVVKIPESTINALKSPQNAVISDGIAATEEPSSLKPNALDESMASSEQFLNGTVIEKSRQIKAEAIQKGTSTKEKRTRNKNGFHDSSQVDQNHLPLKQENSELQHSAYDSDVEYIPESPPKIIVIDDSFSNTQDMFNIMMNPIENDYREITIDRPLELATNLNTAGGSTGTISSSNSCQNQDFPSSQVLTSQIVSSGSTEEIIPASDKLERSRELSNPEEDVSIKTAVDCDMFQLQTKTDTATRVSIDRKRMNGNIRMESSGSDDRDYLIDEDSSPDHSPQNIPQIVDTSPLPPPTNSQLLNQDETYVRCAAIPSQKSQTEVCNETHQIAIVQANVIPEVVSTPVSDNLPNIPFIQHQQRPMPKSHASNNVALLPRVVQDSYFTCLTYLDLQRVSFEREMYKLRYESNQPVLEWHEEKQVDVIVKVNLDFCQSLHIKGDTSQILMHLTSHEWKSVMTLLKAVRKFEYIPWDTEPTTKSLPYRILRLFFQTLPRFSQVALQFFPTGAEKEVRCLEMKPNYFKSVCTLSQAINPLILEKMKALKAKLNNMKDAGSK